MKRQYVPAKTNSQAFDIKLTPAEHIRANAQQRTSALLANLTFAVKATIGIKGFPFVDGWKGRYGTPKDHAPVIWLLLAAGATLIGQVKSTTHACGFDGTDGHLTETGHTPAPHNGRSHLRVPGASSCGSASAVAHSECDFTLAGDTGGSIRVPASYQGIIGYRPTVGRISTNGTVPYTPDYDTIGVMARSTDVMRRVGTVLFKNDFPKNKKTQLFILRDTLLLCNPDVQAAFQHQSTLIQKNQIAKIKIISFETIFNSQDQIQTLKKLGENFSSHPKLQQKSFGDEFNPHNLNHWREVFESIQQHEVILHHGDWVRQHYDEKDYGPETNNAMGNMLNLQLDDETYKSLLQCRDVFRVTINSFMTENNAYLCFPTTPFCAPKIAAVLPDPTRAHNLRVFNHPFLASMAHCPEITLPLLEVKAYPEGSMPVGISLVGTSGSDRQLIKDGCDLYERAKAAQYSPTVTSKL